MTNKYFQDLLSQEPFKPMELGLDNGRTVFVGHPEYVLLAPKMLPAVVIYDEKADRVTHISLDHVSTIDQEPAR